MRLLILDQFSDPGGAQQVLLELLPAIRRRGWHALVGLPGEGAMFASLHAVGADVEQISCGPFRSGPKSSADAARLLAQLPRLALQIRRLAARIRPDLIYVNGPRLLPAVALARLRPPVLFHSHSYLPSGLARTLAGRALRRTNAFTIAVCEFVAQVWRAWLPAARVQVIYNGVSGPSAARRRAAHHQLAIGCIGRIAPEKGQREFLQAATVIHRSLPNARFVICGAPAFGDRAAARYFEQVRTAATGLPVNFTGWVTDVYPILEDLDVLLVPSAGHEATTRVILEAFAAQVPVIAFRAGGIPEIIEHGSNGFLAGSAGELAQLSIDLLGSEPRRLQTITDRAAADWRTRFTLDHFHRQVLEVIERLATDGGVTTNGAVVTNANIIKPRE